MKTLLDATFLFLGLVLYLWERREYRRRFPSFVAGAMMALGLLGIFFLHS